MYRFIFALVLIGPVMTAQPTPRIDSAGAIRSQNGGYIFPDGTVQTTAAIVPGVVTTSMIADGAITQAKLAVDLVASGGINRVVRGIATFNANTTTDVKTTFDPDINPEKSVVLLSAPVFSRIPGAGDYDPSRLGAALIELKEGSITIAVDYPFGAREIIYPCRVSFQIIEFR